MALVSNGRYCRIAHVTVDQVTFAGSVRVEVFPSEPAFYDMGESPVQQTYPVQWLRNANYVLDAYLHLLTLADFAGMVMDGEVLPDSGGVLVLPARPSLHHFVVDGAWVADLDAVKSAARERINDSWKAAERSGFMAYGKLIDSDDKAVTRILGAAQGAQVAIATGQVFDISWTCADGSELLMTETQLAQIPLIVTMAGNVLHMRCLALKVQIDAAATVEEVAAVVW